MTVENPYKKAKPTTPIWQNSDNLSYYEAVPIETLRKYATIGGFESGCDIDIVFDHIKDAGSILEIGAGYGRVLNNLLERGFGGELFAIERSDNLFQHLQSNYSGRATVINGDINHFQPENKFDVILWMWSSISDFSKPEHVSILQKISGWLSDNGLLILDTISHTTTLADEFTLEDQNYIERAAHGTAYGYIPSSQEITEYAQILNFNIKQIEYKTKTNRPRIMHFLKKED